MLCTVSTHDRVCTVSSHPFIIPSIAVPLQGRMHKDLPTRIGQKLLHTQKPKEKKFQKMPLSLADVKVHILLITCKSYFGYKLDSLFNYVSRASKCGFI